MSSVLVGVVMEENAVAANYLDVRQLAMLASLFVPLVVNLLSKKTASDGLKAVINIVAVAVVSVLSLWINPSGQDVTLWLVANTFLAALITSFVAYKGVWKPTGVAGSVASSTANFGLGSPPTLQTDSKGVEDLGQVDKDPRE